MILWSQCYRADACATQYEFIVVMAKLRLLHFTR